MVAGEVYLLNCKCVKKLGSPRLLWRSSLRLCITSFKDDGGGAAASWRYLITSGAK